MRRPVLSSWRGFSGLLTVRAALIAVILSMPFLASAVPFVRLIDGGLIALRFEYAPRDATGTIAFVAIDKQSLDSVGVWPWPRSVHADLLEKLTAAGVNDIFLDIDFSARSTQQEDARLAEALAEAGGGVILPVFEQHAAAGNLSRTVVSRPIAPLAQNSWPAFANVDLGEDGNVRELELGGYVDGKPMQSAAAVLARSGQDMGRLLIDYSIDVGSVPVYSVRDVLEGKVSQAQLKGRSVVVGAFATELKDVFPVPVYGVLSGPMLHILATETLLQQRILWSVDQRLMEFLLAVVLVAAVLRLRSARLWYQVSGAVGLLLAGEYAAYLLQKHHGLIVHMATPALLVVAGLVLLMNEKLDFASWLAELARAENRNTRHLLKRILSDSADAIIIFDDQLNVLEHSRSTGLLFSIQKASMRRRRLAEFAPPALIEAIDSMKLAFAADPARTQSKSLTFDLTHRLETRTVEAVATLSPIEGHDVFGSSVRGSFVGCMTIRDMTTRHLYEKKLQELSQFDELTGLFNRRELGERISRHGKSFSVCVIDLHRFAILNATLGRQMGDALLGAVGARLGALAKRSSGFAGRLGGDVFCVAFPLRSDEEVVHLVAELLEAVERPFVLEAMTVETTARLGICQGTAEIGGAQAWIQFAEQALDEAKKVGGRGFKLHDPQSAAKQQRSRQLEREMRHSLEEGQFFLLYQPQVQLASGRLVGAEALVRWKHPILGTVSPVEFIGIAEANGFICTLGRWILQEACKRAALWPSELSIAVNISAIQLVKSDIVADVRAALSASGLAPARLHLEITESAFIDATETLLETFQQLRGLGVRLALDDFGTGYSSLSYIAGFPLDKLKVDQSFVRKIVTDPGSRAIVQAIKSLADGLGLKVVCEGIEGLAEWRLLTDIGFDEGQGYYFGKPQSAGEIEALADSAPWITALAS